MSVEDDDQRDPFEESKIAALNKAFKGKKAEKSKTEAEECKTMPKVQPKPSKRPIKGFL